MNLHYSIPLPRLEMFSFVDAETSYSKLLYVAVG